MKRDLSGIYILEPFYLHFKLCILHLTTVAKHNRQKLQTSTFECFKHKVRCYIQILTLKLLISKNHLLSTKILDVSTESCCCFSYMVLFYVDVLHLPKADPCSRFIKLYPINFLSRETFGSRSSRFPSSWKWSTQCHL